MSLIIAAWYEKPKDEKEKKQRHEKEEKQDNGERVAVSQVPRVGGKAREVKYNWHSQKEGIIKFRIRS